MISLMQAQMQMGVADYDFKDDVISLARMDAQALDFATATFDAVIMNFGLHFLPDPVLGISEMHRGRHCARDGME